MSWVCCFTSGSFGGGGCACYPNVLALAGFALGRSLDLGCGDLAGDELGVVLDPADQGRPAGVLPGEAEEVEARHLGYTPAVLHAAVRADHRWLDPRVVGAIARRPDHGVDVEFAAVSEADRAS